MVRSNGVWYARTMYRILPAPTARRQFLIGVLTVASKSLQATMSVEGGLMAHLFAAGIPLFAT